MEADPIKRVWEDLAGFAAMRMINGPYLFPTKPRLGFEVNEMRATLSLMLSILGAQLFWRGVAKP